MPFTVPATEDSDNEFQFDPDWLELMATSDPAGADVMSIDGQEATLVGQIPANKMRSALAFFVGLSYTEDGQNLKRVLPARHPIWSHLYVRSAQFHRRNPCLNPDGIEPSQASVEDSIYEKTGFYLTCWVTLHFAPRFYDLLEDDDTPWEALRFCQFYSRTEPSLDTISASTGRYLKFIEGDPAGPPQKSFPGDITEYRHTTTHTILWENVAEEFVADKNGFYKNLIQPVGCVNKDAFMGIPAGCALYLPPRFRRFVQPVRTESGANLYGVDVEINLNVFDPEPAVGYDNSVYRGWQLMPWVDGGNVDDTNGAGGVGWVSVERPDGSAFLPWADFNRIFYGVQSP